MQKQFSESYLSHYYWHMDGSRTPWLGEGTTYDGKITVVAASTDFDESERDDAAVEALSETKKVIIKIPNGVVSMELRFRADGTAGDQHKLELFAAAGVDHYRHMVQLTIDQGAQEYTAGSIFFIDTVAHGTEIWHSTITEITTTDHIGGYVFNTHGYDRLWIVASTLDTTGGSPNMSNLYVDWKKL